MRWLLLAPSMQSSRLKQGAAYVSVIFGVTSMGVTVEIRRCLRCRSHCQRRNCVERPRRHVRLASRTSKGAECVRYAFQVPCRGHLTATAVAVAATPETGGEAPTQPRSKSACVQSPHIGRHRDPAPAGHPASSPARRAVFHVHHAVSPPAINARRPRRSSSVSADRSGRVSSGTCFSSFSGAYFSMSWISLI